MNITRVKNRVKEIEDRVFYEDRHKWIDNWITIYYAGEDNDLNNNRKYRLEYEGKKLVYDKIEDFYKEYNVYPKRDINPHFITIVDNSHLEKYMYMVDEEG